MKSSLLRKFQSFAGLAMPWTGLGFMGFLLGMMMACASGSSLGGVWEIQEEDRTYVATLDPQGNGTYTWKNGIIKTTQFTDRKWKGTWHQSGNDREGGFEILLSEDGKEAEGVWWYTRVGDNDNIPAKKFGGDYLWIRLPAQSTDNQEK